MTVETIYIADDGTRFDDENECSIYERSLRLKQVSNDVVVLDNKGQQIELDRLPDEGEYLFCKTQEAADTIFNEMCYDMTLPWDEYSQVCPGAWYWSCHTDRWYDVGDLLGQIKNIYKLIGEG